MEYSIGEKICFWIGIKKRKIEGIVIGYSHNIRNQHIMPYYIVLQTYAIGFRFIRVRPRQLA